jgi:hypothetical protein
MTNQAIAEKQQSPRYELNGLRNLEQSDLRRREREALAEGNAERLALARENFGNWLSRD